MKKVYESPDLSLLRFLPEQNLAASADLETQDSRLSGTNTDVDFDDLLNNG